MNAAHLIRVFILLFLLSTLFPYQKARGCGEGPAGCFEIAGRSFLGYSPRPAAANVPETLPVLWMIPIEVIGALAATWVFGFFIAAARREKKLSSLEYAVVIGTLWTVLGVVLLTVQWTNALMLWAIPALGFAAVFFVVLVARLLLDLINLLRRASRPSLSAYAIVIPAVVIMAYAATSFAVTVPRCFCERMAD